jgi:hypothetical protein
MRKKNLMGEDKKCEEGGKNVRREDQKVRSEDKKLRSEDKKGEE